MLMEQNLRLFKIKETRLKCYEGSVTVLQKGANYQEVRVNLTNTQLHKLKSTEKNKTGKILRLSKKTLKMNNCHINYF